MNDIFTSKLYDNETFYTVFTKDLQRARDTVIIESPFITTRRMDEIMPVLTSIRRRNVSITVNTRNPDEHNTDYEIQALAAIDMLQHMGVKVLYTVKHHRKLAIIDSEILWEGSLNILSQNDSCEIMRRSVSCRLSQEMQAFIGAKRWL